MLRPIPEDTSDHAALDDAESTESVSVVGAVASSDGDAEARSTVSVVSAVVADPEGGAQRGIDGSSRDGLLKKHSRKRKKDRKRRRRKRRWASWRSFVVMGVVVSAAVAIVVVIVTTTGGSSVGGNEEETEAPSQSSAPSMAPTIDPETEASLDTLIDEINVPLSDPSNEVNLVLEPARALARRWMLTRDLLRDEILVDPTSVRFTQRYVLTLLFFSMQFNKNNISTEVEDATIFAEESECDWTGVFCDQAIVDQTSTTTVIVPVVRRIEWSGVDAVGVLPPELRELTYLQEFNVSSNELRGSIPSLWFESRGSGPTVQDEFYLPFLYMLDCSFNKLGGALNPSFWSLPSLRLVYLTNNSITGELPSSSFMEEEATLSFLQDIWIDNNLFSGSIPHWIFNRPLLKSFIAEHNQFTGTLATVETISEDMVVLDLSFNNISGAIPASFFSASSLSYLYLDHNNFTQLPNLSYEERASLVEVWLHVNNLRGVIPSNFGSGWRMLQELRLEENQLTGEIISGCENETAGSSSVMWPSLSLLNADCKRPTAFVEAPVICICCTECF